MKHTYKTKGTCASQIEFSLEDGLITNVKFTNGCNGSLAGVAKLVEGQPPEKVYSILSGIKCGARATSCPDQLARALAAVPRLA